MISEYICANITECRSRIEEDFQVDLTLNLTSPSVLMRGENYPYEKTESSMKRFLTAADGKTMKPFYYVSPFIDFEEIYAEYHSTAHQLKRGGGCRVPSALWIPHRPI